MEQEMSSAEARGPMLAIDNTPPPMPAMYDRLNPRMALYFGHAKYASEVTGETENETGIAVCALRDLENGPVANELGRAFRADIFVVINSYARVLLRTMRSHAQEHEDTEEH